MIRHGNLAPPQAVQRSTNEDLLWSLLLRHFTLKGRGEKSNISKWFSYPLIYMSFDVYILFKNNIRTVNLNFRGKSLVEELKSFLAMF